MRGIFKIADQKPERFGIRASPARAGGRDGADFRLAWQLRENLAAQVEPVGVVVQNQNFMLCVHFRSGQPLTPNPCKLKREKHFF